MIGIDYSGSTLGAGCGVHYPWVTWSGGDEWTKPGYWKEISRGEWLLVALNRVQSKYLVPVYRGKTPGLTEVEWPPELGGGQNRDLLLQTVVPLNGGTNPRYSSKQRFVWSASFPPTLSTCFPYSLGGKSIYWHYCVVSAYTVMLSAKNAWGTCQAQLVLHVGSPCRHFSSLGRYCGCTGPCGFLLWLWYALQQNHQGILRIRVYYSWVLKDTRHTQRPHCEVKSKGVRWGWSGEGRGNEPGILLLLGSEDRMSKVCSFTLYWLI